MFFHSQTDAVSLEQNLAWPNIPANARLASAQLTRTNIPPTSATQWMTRQDIYVTDHLDGLKNVELVFDHYRELGSLSREMIDRITVLAQTVERDSFEREYLPAIADTSFLEDALADLKSSPDEARDEDLPIPSNKALQNGEHVLRAVYSMWPRRFEVYPMPNGEVAIDAPAGPGRSILILCDSEGGALCSVNFDRTHRRAHYSNARVLPDGFLRDAIRDMTANA